METVRQPAVVYSHESAVAIILFAAILVRNNRAVYKSGILWNPFGFWPLANHFIVTRVSIVTFTMFGHLFIIAQSYITHNSTNEHGWVFLWHIGTPPYSARL